jgi:hypothetical protein
VQVLGHSRQYSIGTFPPPANDYTGMRRWLHFGITRQRLSRIRWVGDTVQAGADKACAAISCPAHFTTQNSWEMLGRWMENVAWIYLLVSGRLPYALSQPLALRIWVLELEPLASETWRLETLPGCNFWACSTKTPPQSIQHPNQPTSDQPTHA